MKVVDIETSRLIPYDNNPRLNEDAVPYVAESIRTYGFKVPIVIDKHNVIVTGHTRWKAAQSLHMKTVPCIIADDLTDDQIRAFRLVDNKVAEYATWDFSKLNIELDSIDMDLSSFDFEVDLRKPTHSEDPVEDIQDGEDFRERYRERTVSILNLDLMNCGRTGGKYDIPQLIPMVEIPEVEEWIGFNYVLSEEHPENKGVHFFVDDYQFERVWNEPDKYIERLREFAVVATPDFSPYEDMPFTAQLWNHYRKHWVGRYWQAKGISVIPTIRASADPRSLEWYLEGEPQNGVVMISSMWCTDEETRRYFLDEEYGQMVEKLHPSKILVYGNELPELQGVEYIKSFTRKRFGD